MLDIGNSAQVQRSEVDHFEIWEYCGKERKAASAICLSAKGEFVKQAEQLSAKDSLRIYNTLELKELINKVGELAQEYIALIKGIVEKRESFFTEMISSVYEEGSNKKVDSMLKSFSELSMLFNDTIEFEINQKDLECKLALGNFLKTKISSQRSVKEEKNQTKAEQLMKVNQFLRKTHEKKSLVDEKLEFISKHKPKVDVSKIYIDRVETEMNVAVMNANNYAKKIELAEANLERGKLLLTQSVTRLTNKSEKLNSIVEKYFVMKEVKDEDYDHPKITEGDVIAAIYEFEKASSLVGRADALFYILERDLKNLKIISTLKSEV